MIANTLIFLMGVLVTALLALILAPIVWRKAQSLAQRDFEATVPISANEIRAEFDRVRAEAAVAIRRQEVISAEIRGKAAKAEADHGRNLVESALLQKRNRDMERAIADQDSELSALRSAYAGQTAEIDDLSRQLAESRLDTDQAREELDALGTQFRELRDIAEERKIELVAAEAKIERLTDRARLTGRTEGSEQDSIEKLAAELAAAQRSLRQERAAHAVLEEKVADLSKTLAGRDKAAPDTAFEAAAAAVPTPMPAAPARAPRSRSQWSKPAVDVKASGSARVQAALGRREVVPLEAVEKADIRERISDVAARVIRMTALAEGPQSPLAALLETATEADGTRVPGERPTLAERVRLLAEAERKAAS
ncbi:hypothetical protein ASG43_01510 [Aureimonas sp. Leaf454]|uniref:hypothetical protein n=1 Tax=Aureimonas sp. Leaf454 TaxID=1736381 RepID=UPI0006F8AB4E|nr:hypothetical protein [Aureimonas sp. Leaf454]KQT54315.1 hypothetical protein ASG43_01510 [Aureimonas sp. Leaf454]